MNLIIEKAIYGGAGLSRVPADKTESHGKAVFVPFTLPGESISAHITGARSGYATAAIDEIVTPAATRVTPLCPYFGACGGCHYQHSTYPGQLEIKTSILRESLERGRLTDLPEIVPIQAEPWAYRNRIRLQIGTAGDTFVPAYHRRESHQTLPVDQCPIAAPVLQSAILALRTPGLANPSLSIEEIELFTNESQSALLLSAFTSRPVTDSRSFDRFAAALQQHLPQLTGAALLHRPREVSNRTARKPSRPTPNPTLIASWGKSALTYTAARFPYRVSLGAFFQINRFLVESLLDLVTAEPEGALAWDLYAGVGLFARALTTRFDQVVAVEAAPASVSDLKSNLAGTASTALRATTLDFLRRHQAADPVPGLILLDPPRAGLGSEVTQLLARIAAPAITYVSCDPATLSRDLKSLIDSGYSLDRLHMIDLFPQTFHIETVAILSRK